MCGIFMPCNIDLNCYLYYRMSCTSVRNGSMGVYMEAGVMLRTN